MTLLGEPHKSGYYSITRDFMDEKPVGVQDSGSKGVGSEGKGVVKIGSEGSKEVWVARG
jgi:hypothetical protein